MTTFDRRLAPCGSQPASTEDDPVRADEESVLTDIAGMIEEVLEEDGYGLDDIEISMDTTFNHDLELESIYLVALGGLLEKRYGSRINFAEFQGAMEFDEIIELTVGRLVKHIVKSLKAAETG